jgi:uncharacterized membrane protein
MSSNPFPSTPGVPTNTPAEQSLVTYTHIIYGLHAFGVVMGVLSTAVTVVGGFVFSLPSIIAVIMNYAKRSQVRGTWLESHFSWQISTFWFAVLWALVIGGISAVLMLVLVGFVTWYIGFIALGVWIIYRVVRGWTALRDHRAMYL